MQKQIKLRYNPYENRIQFSIFQNGGESWGEISENSDLRKYENQTCVLANCAEDIVSLINRYHNVSAEGVMICFEGTDEDYGILQAVVEHENNSVPKKGRIVCRKTATFKSADEAIDIIRSAYGRISSEFSDYLPDRDGYNDLTSDEQRIGQTISSFNTTVSIEIPVCIIGTYSIGKSALINAIVGAEILPSAVKQCTAKNVRVINDQNYSITISYKDEEITFAVERGIIIPQRTADAATELLSALLSIISIEKSDEISIIRNILRVLNGEIRSDISDDIGFNVTISLPFGGSILNRQTAKIVLYDTPGSDNSDVDQKAHREALEKLMKHQTNALPVFVMDREHALSNDHADVKTLIDSNKSGFSSPNCIIVFSKAERLTESQYREDIPPALINWHGGITFLHVCAIGALGAKKGCDTWADAQYAEVYRDWYRKFDQDGKSLPKYNRVPCGRTMDPNARTLVSDELYASGIPSLEDEINYYVLRYANYKKCVNGRALLLQAMALAEEQLKTEEKRLQKDKEKKVAEQAKIREELLSRMRTVKPRNIDVYDIAIKYDGVLKAYCATVPSAVASIWNSAKNRKDKKEYMSAALQKHCMDNLFLPAYEGEDGIAHLIIQRLVNYAEEYITSIRQIVEERHQDLSPEARADLIKFFGAIGAPKFKNFEIKGTNALLEFSQLLNFRWLEEKGLEAVASSVCKKLDIQKEGPFKKGFRYGEFQRLCIFNPTTDYEKQLNAWSDDTFRCVEKTINRDNAILSKYDTEIALTEAKIQDMRARLKRLRDVRMQLETVLSVKAGAD